jgi:hypothetical protein
MSCLEEGERIYFVPIASAGVMRVFIFHTLQKMHATQTFPGAFRFSSFDPVFSFEFRARLTIGNNQSSNLQLARRGIKISNELTTEGFWPGNAIDNLV